MLLANIERFSYSDSHDKQHLRNINFTLLPGKVLWVNAPTGGGKTTLLKLLAGILPSFEPCDYTGSVLLDGKLLDAESARYKVSFCFQLPEYQFLFDSVSRQFHLRPGDYLGQKYLSAICEELGIQYLLKESVKDISTGQRKLVAVAAALVKQRRLRLFDEPTANLDLEATSRVIQAIRRTVANSITVIASHDARIKDICDSTLRLPYIHQQNPVVPQESYDKKRRASLPTRQEEITSSRELVFDCRDISYIYPNRVQGLKPQSFQIYNRERLSLQGENGKGKTTLLRILAGNMKPSTGHILINRLGTCGVVFQENERQIFCGSVMDEMLLGTMQSRGAAEEAKLILQRIGLVEFAQMHPLFLSGGEKKKLLIAAVLMHHPDTLILDEPFAGMDTDSVESVLKLLEEVCKEKQMTIIIVDHKTPQASRFIERQISLS